jgi:hypothetical protein
VTPDLKTYVVGSGSYNIKIEKAFVETSQTRRVSSNVIAPHTAARGQT